MSVDVDPSLRSAEEPQETVQTYNDGMGMVFDKIPLKPGETANSTLIENGQKFSLENGRSEVSPDIP